MIVSAFLFIVGMLRNLDLHCCLLVETRVKSTLYSTPLATPCVDLWSSFSLSAYMSMMVTVITLPYRDDCHRIFQIYVLDVQVWYTVASSLLGGLEGARDKLGEVILNSTSTHIYDTRESLRMVMEAG